MWLKTSIAKLSIGLLVASLLVIPADAQGGEDGLFCTDAGCYGGETQVGPVVINPVGDAEAYGGAAAIAPFGDARCTWFGSFFGPFGEPTPCVAASGTGDASCYHTMMALCVAVSATGNASCEGYSFHCIAVSGTGDADSPYMFAVSGTGDADGALFGLSLLGEGDEVLSYSTDGDATGALVAVSTAGEAHGQLVGISLAGDASGRLLGLSLGGDAACDLPTYCIAASATGDAQATCSPYSLDQSIGPLSLKPGCLALAPQGNASCSGGYRCQAIGGEGAEGDGVVVSPTGDAQGGRVSATATGDAEGVHAFSATGDAEGSNLGASGTGDAEARLVALSGTGAADGTAAASGTGDASGQYAAVSATGSAECREDVPVPDPYGEDIDCIAVDGGTILDD